MLPFLLLVLCAFAPACALGAPSAEVSPLPWQPGGPTQEPPGLPMFKGRLTQAQRHPRSARAERLAELAQEVDPSWPAGIRAWALEQIADEQRSLGDPRAPETYDRAIAAAGQAENPVYHAVLLNKAATYWRLYRGPGVSIYGRAERYLCEAEAILAREQAQAEALASDSNEVRVRKAQLRHQLPGLERLLRRSRAELVKPEGVALFSGPGPGVAVSASMEVGETPVPFGDLTTPFQAIRAQDAAFDPRRLVRDLDRTRGEVRGRIRLGEDAPFLDVSGFRGDAQDALVDQNPGAAFHELDFRGGAIAVEHRQPTQEFGDFRLRLGFSQDRLEPELGSEERVRRGVAELGYALGVLDGIKAELSLVGALGNIDLQPGGKDTEHIAGAQVRCFDYRDAALGDKADPRGTEVRAGWVQFDRAYRGATTVHLVRDTWFGSYKAREMLGGSVDVEILENFFTTDLAGGPAGRDSNSLESNLIVTWRVVDQVNDLSGFAPGNVLSITQAGVNLRPFVECSLSGDRDFEAAGFVVAPFAEVLSHRTGWATVLVEVAYEVRDYFHVGEVEHMVRGSVKVGLF